MITTAESVTRHMNCIRACRGETRPRRSTIRRLTRAISMPRPRSAIRPWYRAVITLHHGRLCSHFSSSGTVMNPITMIPKIYTMPLRALALSSKLKTPLMIANGAEPMAIQKRTIRTRPIM